MTDEDHRTPARNASASELGGDERPSTGESPERQTLLRDGRQRNVYVALSLALFCLLIFVWIIVRVAGHG